MFSSVATPTPLDNTVEILEDGSTFVLTGDIPAMWLRDSTAQLRPYLHVAKRDDLLRQTIAGLVKRQMTLILKDPYANSFNIEGKLEGGTTRLTTQTLMAGFGNANTGGLALLSVAVGLSPLERDWRD